MAHNIVYNFVILKIACIALYISCSVVMFYFEVKSFRNKFSTAVTIVSLTTKISHSKYIPERQTT
jgi:hypothetical protein